MELSAGVWSSTATESDPERYFACQWYSSFYLRRSVWYSWDRLPDDLCDTFVTSEPQVVGSGPKESPLLLQQGALATVSQLQEMIVRRSGDFA